MEKYTDQDGSLKKHGAVDSLDEKNKKELTDHYYSFVAGEMKDRRSQAQIAYALVTQGVEKSMAWAILDKLIPEIEEKARKEQFTIVWLIPALLGASLAALIGGVGWGLIVYLTGYPVGYTAWIIGILCGFSVVGFTIGKKGRFLQVLSLTACLISLVLGKFFIFFVKLKDSIIAESGRQAAKHVSAYSAETIMEFFSKYDFMQNKLEYFWILLGIVFAWSVPKGLGVKVKKARKEEAEE